MWGIERGNSKLLGFVMSCLFCKAITIEEFKTWCLYIVDKVDKVPDYFFDLLTKNYSSDADINKIIGFITGWPMAEKKRSSIKRMGEIS